MSKPQKSTKKQKKSSSSSSSTLEDYNFSIYIYKVLKQVHPDTGLSGSALANMVNLVKVDISIIVDIMNNIMIRTGAKTLSSAAVITAIKVGLPGDLAKQGINGAEKAIENYNRNFTDQGSNKAKPTQRSTRAGLTFNVTRVEHLMMLLSSVNRKSSTAAVALTSLVEYMTLEILELAGNAARNHNKARITPRHIKLAIDNDEELRFFYRKTIISGGVSQQIHTFLLPEQKGEKKQKSEKTKAKPKVTEKTKAKPKVTEKTKDKPKVTEKTKAKVTKK